MKKQSKNSSKILYYVAIGVLVFGFGLLLLEKTQVTNFYTKPVVVADVAPRPINDIQYTPASSTDNDEINQKKADGTIDQPDQTFSNNTPVSVVLTAAGQDEKGGAIIVRVLVNDTVDGSCKTTISKDNVVKEYSGTVINTGTYYACEPLDIPVSDISAGTWQLTVVVTSGDRTGSTQQDVTVTL